MTYSVKQKRAHLKITHVRVFHDVFNRKRTSLFLATCSTEDQIEGSNDSNKTCCEFLFMFIRCDVESLLNIHLFKMYVNKTCCELLFRFIRCDRENKYTPSHQRWFLGVANNHPVFMLKQMPYIKRSKCRNNKLTTYKVQTLFGDHLLTMCMSVGKSTEPNNIIKVKQLQLSKKQTTRT